MIHQTLPTNSRGIRPQSRSERKASAIRRSTDIEPCERRQDLSKKILRIDMTHRKATYEEVPKKWAHWAGRALTSAITFDEVEPTCHPLGPNNKLAIAPG